MKMSWNEIIKRYPNEWIMLVDYEYENNDAIDPSAGEVVAHHSSRKEFGELMKKIDVKTAAILYTGSISDGRAILCC